jgi:hypothetical protein
MGGHAGVPQIEKFPSLEEYHGLIEKYAVWAKSL